MDGTGLLPVSRFQKSLVGALLPDLFYFRSGQQRWKSDVPTRAPPGWLLSGGGLLSKCPLFTIRNLELPRKAIPCFHR